MRERERESERESLCAYLFYLYSSLYKQTSMHRETFVRFHVMYIYMYEYILCAQQNCLDTYTKLQVSNTFVHIDLRFFQKLSSCLSCITQWQFNFLPVSEYEYIKKAKTKTQHYKKKAPLYWKQQTEEMKNCRLENKKKLFEKTVGMQEVDIRNSKLEKLVRLNNIYMKNIKYIF